VVRVLAIVVMAYLGVVVAFESLVVAMGKWQAENGVGPEET
jgi:hypothetical protein